MSKKSTKDILQAPRGMRDFLGDEFLKRKNFFSTAEEIAQSYGFSGIETPILEHTPIFHKGVGEGTDIVDKEMYNLKTSGGDLLTLRPEGTASVMRAYIEHGMGSLPGPQMLYYNGPFFRHDKPQKGRYRQLYQFGLEIMGSKEPIYDALIIKTGYDIIQKNRKEIIVEINSLGSNSERENYLEELRKFYLGKKEKMAETDIHRIETNPLRILDSKELATVEINKEAPLLSDFLGKESQEHFQKVLSQLDILNVHYEINPKLVRGLGYYEYTVFEFVCFDENGEKSFALGGGGRYDGLAEMIGHTKSVPSVGLGLGADRIIESSDFQNTHKTKKIPLLLADETALSKAINITQKNKEIFLYPLTQKFGKQLARIEKEGFEKVYILGENEIQNNEIILKDLETGEQKNISLENSK